MKVNRREFIRNTGLAVATPLLISELVACTSSSTSNENKADSTVTASTTSSPSISEFGIQLWTVKEDIAKDTKGTLKTLADYGYKFIESFSHKGPEIFCGMKPKELKTYLDSVGLTMYSSHCDPIYTFDLKREDEFKKLADDAASISMTHLFNPYMGDKIKTLEDAKKATEGLNRCGEICKKAGLKYGYHNHHYAFEKIDGQYPEDIFLTESNPDLVDFEMDIYWLVATGQDPTAWLKKYPNRFRYCHVKDIYPEAKVKEIMTTEKIDPQLPYNASCNLGTGRIDFATILKVAAENGTQHFVVEQERFDAGTKLQAAKADADYMNKLVFA